MHLENDVNIKKNIRKEILGKLRDQAPVERSEKSRKIQEKFISSDIFKACNTIMTYISLESEVGTEYINSAAFDLGKKVVVPSIDLEKEEITALEIKSVDDLVEGPYGIKVPGKGSKKVNLKELDIIVVPAVAFDRSNNRLGRGKGYYDRFLSQGDLSGTRTIGLAFQCQIVDVLPTDFHDIPVSMVITE